MSIKREIYKEALSYMEMFRRLNYPADMLFAVKGDDDGPAVFVALHYMGKKFHVYVGRLPDDLSDEDFVEEWKEAAKSWNELDNEVAMDIYFNSEAITKSEKLVVELARKGFEAPPTLDVN